MSTAQILAANELAWCHWTADPSLDSPAAQWLKARGIDPASAARAGFRIGWAAPDWTQLRDTLTRHRVPTTIAAAAGLIRTSETGRIYDGFRSRAVFAVRDIARGRIVGFTARHVGPADNSPKYLNSPANPAYRKKDQLFGAWEARQRLTTDRAAITNIVVCEGPLDVLAITAHPQWVAVAPCGTAMTASQAEWIATLSKLWQVPVTLAYDGDSAGQLAAQRANTMLAGLDLPGLEVAELPTGQDPAGLAAAQLQEVLGGMR